MHLSLPHDSIHPLPLLRSLINWDRIDHRIIITQGDVVQPMAWLVASLEILPRYGPKQKY